MSKKALFLFTPMPFALAVVLLASTMTAQAGFEWRGAAPVAAPAVVADETVPEPVITWDGNVSEPLMPVEKVGQVVSVPVAPPAPPSLPAAVVLAEKPASVEILSGFGTDIPLAIALQQVVPPGHQFSFASNVNPGVNVSWQGGKPWKDVLGDMLSAKGFDYKIQNNVVTVSPVSAPVMQHQAVAPVLPDTSGVEQVSSSVVWNQAPEQKSPVVDKTPVDIRRQKPSSLLHKFKRMTQTAPAEEKVENIAVPRAAAAPVEPQIENIQESPAAPVAQDYLPLPIVKTPAAVPPAPVMAPLSVTGGKMSMDQTAPPSLSAPTWHAAKGQTLRDVVANWSEVANVELYWSIDYDYRLEEDFSRSGTYDEAVGALLDKFAGARPQPYGQLHQGENSPRVLVVKSYDLIP